LVNPGITNCIKTRRSVLCGDFVSCQIVYYYYRYYYYYYYYTCEKRQS